MHELVIIVAQYFLIFSLAGVMIVFFLQDKSNKKRMFLQLILGGVLALALAWLARHFYYNPRPFVEGNFIPYFKHIADNGFVSDHMLLASFLAFCTYFYNKRVGSALALFAIAIGAARVVAGVHHWLDIFAAIMVSLISAGITYLVVNWAIKRPSSGVE